MLTINCHLRLFHHCECYQCWVRTHDKICILKNIGANWFVKTLKIVLEEINRVILGQTHVNYVWVLSFAMCEVGSKLQA